MDDEFDSVSWQDDPGKSSSGQQSGRVSVTDQRDESPEPATIPFGGDAVDTAGLSTKPTLDIKVSAPLKENDGTKDAYMSYLCTTETNFPSFSKPKTRVRRRFTDFVFLFRELSKQYPQCAVPPLPDKHKMEYVRGDRFGTDFTQRRAYSLHRFLRRCAAHPVLRRATLLVIFLESADWNAHMRMHTSRNSTDSIHDSSLLSNSPTTPSSTGTTVFDNIADTFVNVFAKLHKPDKRFLDVKEKSTRLEDDLGHVTRSISRLVRRQTELETDYADLGTQFLRLTSLEPGVEDAIHDFATAIESTAAGMVRLREHTDRVYLGSLRDMEAYSTQSMKNLLKSREAKQLDFEALTEYLNKASYDRDVLASQQAHGSDGGSGLPVSTGFIRAKIEDVRGVDHESARRERLRKLEFSIERLVKEVEDSRRVTEAFDLEVLREVQDFERIKAVEFRECLGGLTQKNIEFYQNVGSVWGKYLQALEAAQA